MGTISVINDVITDLGYTGDYYYIIEALNYICKDILGGTGGHKYHIDAYNEMCTLMGYTGGHTRNINALNTICVGGGGTGGHTKTENAWAEIHSGSLLNQDEIPDGIYLIDEEGAFISEEDNTNILIIEEE